MISLIIEENSEYIKKEINNGVSVHSIAKTLECSKCAVRNFLKRNGLKSKIKSKVNINNLLKDQLNKVIDLYDQGHSATDIGRILGHTRQSVTYLLKINGHKIKDRRYNIDETFFDNIDTEAKAYMYGFILADGTVSLDGRLKISIRDYDGYILEKFVKALGYTGPLFDDVGHRIYYPENKMRVLCLYRKRLVDKLIEHGCVPAKTWSLQFPPQGVISDEVLPHFTRGFMDGDGWICSGNSKEVGTSSTQEFIEGFCERVLKPLSIIYHIGNTPNNKIDRIRFSSKDSIRKFYNYMYQNATLFLLRKKQKFEETL